MAAAGIFLLIAMGGGALDASRTYLAKTRLQQACDAGVLAYRRAMLGTTVVSTTYPLALSYFNANFTPGRYGTSNASFPQPTVDSSTVVHGTASVTVPLTLMRIFGASDAALNVQCDAQLQLANTDVMFVLDTTGSMGDTNPGDSTTKIAALRTAVMNFYTTLENVKLPGTQVRYGFVPYANTVNVGMLLRRDWMADKATYQSRVFDIQEVASTGTTISEWTPIPTPTSSTGNPENCTAPASTLVILETTTGPWSTSTPRSRTLTRTVNGLDYSANVDSSGVCTILKYTYNNWKQTATETEGGSRQNFWWYKPVEFDVSGYKGTNANGLMAGNTIGYDKINGPPLDGSSSIIPPYYLAWTSSNACIEERRTLRPGETGTAWDMDVDTVPTPSNPDTQWRPFLPYALFARSTRDYDANPIVGWTYDPVRNWRTYEKPGRYPNSRAACPSAARKLQTKEAGLTSSVLQSYVNGLTSRGDTYHDIGFLWGLRLISREGLFASENASAPNKLEIGRNIILMTDGATDTHVEDYDAYGLPALDRRRSSTSAMPTDADQNAIVESRLLKYCNVAKNQKGITVWVVAFGTELTSLLKNCASSGRAFQANSSSDLNKIFVDIASRIAQLRLSK